MRYFVSAVVEAFDLKHLHHSVYLTCSLICSCTAMKFKMFDILFSSHCNMFVCLIGLDSMQTLWQTCWTSGVCSEHDFFENPAFFTEETMSKTSAGWDESSATSSLLTIHPPLTFSTQRML